MATLWPESNAMVAAVANDTAESLDNRAFQRYFGRQIVAKKLLILAENSEKLPESTTK